MRKTIEITGTISKTENVGKIKTLLETAGISEMNISTIPYYEDWLESLPKENIPGLNDKCQEWIRYWCNGGGDESSETLITDALENLESDVPIELANAIYYSVSGYSKSEFEASCLTIEMINACIGELIIGSEDKHS